MMLTECIACQHGHHERHYRVVQAVPEGMIGGKICPCKGECVERGPTPSIRRQVDQIRRALRSAS